MDCRSRQNYPSRQTRAPSVRFHPLASFAIHLHPGEGFIPNEKAERLLWDSFLLISLMLDEGDPDDKGWTERAILRSNAVKKLETKDLVR
jgi:hypothetical protein